MTLRLEYVKDYASVRLKPRPSITVEMEYLPLISKNSYKTRDGFIKGKVRAWMHDLAFMLDLEMKASCIEFHEPVLLRIEAEAEGTGRLLDTSNCIDCICDAVQEGIGLNDQGFQINAKPSKKGNNPRIVVTVEQME